MTMADPEKICDFCHRETKYVPLVIKATVPNFGANVAARQRSIRVHFCYGCQAEYVFWLGPNGEPTVHLYVSINDAVYRWSVDSDGIFGRLWHIKEPGVPGVKQNTKSDLLKTFKGNLPDITPQNIDEKIRFILLWQ